MIEIEVTQANTSYGWDTIIVSSDDLFVNLDYDMAINLPAGRYRIVPIDE